MKKIGFIDYYLDEWHANNYPEMIKKNSDGSMQVCYAYGKIDSPIGGLTNQQWSDKYGVPLVSSIQELVDKSDCIVLLSPDNPEMHEELAKIPTAFGKRLYIDKVFAPDKGTALRIFERAEKYDTPLYTCSALNFSSELAEIEKEDISVIHSFGSGGWSTHMIHQIEPVVKLMGLNAKRVMFSGTETYPTLTIEFADGRVAYLTIINENFSMKVGYADGSVKNMVVNSPFFDLFIKEMISFFKDGIVPVPKEQTIAVIAIYEAYIKAAQSPLNWISV